MEALIETGSTRRSCVQRNGILIIMLLAVAGFTNGCVTAGSLNDGFRRLDQVWAVEYQKTEDEFRYRVINSGMAATFADMKQTFLALGMPIKYASLADGVMVAEGEAPGPLTLAEWKQVAKHETPRMKEVGGWMFTLPDNPKGYFITLKASMRQFGDQTLVRLDYSIDHPQYRRMGLEPSVYAPPTAVQIGSLKIWRTLTDKSETGKSPPRRRTDQELSRMVL